MRGKASSLETKAATEISIDERFTAYASQPCLVNIDDGFHLQEDLSRVLSHFSSSSQNGLPRDLGTEFLESGQPFQIPQETMQQLHVSALHALADTMQHNVGALMETGPTGKRKYSA